MLWYEVYSHCFVVLTSTSDIPAFQYLLSLPVNHECIPPVSWKKTLSTGLKGPAGGPFEIPGMRRSSKPFPLPDALEIRSPMMLGDFEGYGNCFWHLLVFNGIAENAMQARSDVRTYMNDNVQEVMEWKQRSNPTLDRAMHEKELEVDLAGIMNPSYVSSAFVTYLIVPIVFNIVIVTLSAGRNYVMEPLQTSIFWLSNFASRVLPDDSPIVFGLLHSIDRPHLCDPNLPNDHYCALYCKAPTKTLRGVLAGLIKNIQLFTNSSESSTVQIPFDINSISIEMLSSLTFKSCSKVEKVRNCSLEAVIKR